MYLCVFACMYWTELTLALLTVANEIKALGNSKVFTYQIDLCSREAIYDTAKQVQAQVCVCVRACMYTCMDVYLVDG